MQTIRINANLLNHLTWHVSHQGDGLILWNPKAEHNAKIWASESFGFRLNRNRVQSTYNPMFDDSLEVYLVRMIKRTLPNYDVVCSPRWPLKHLLAECNNIADQVYLSGLRMIGFLIH